MTIEGYTPNFINFGRSAAEKSLAEKARISVASKESRTKEEQKVILSKAQSPSDASFNLSIFAARGALKPIL